MKKIFYLTLLITIIFLSMSCNNISEKDIGDKDKDNSSDLIDNNKEKDKTEKDYKTEEKDELLEQINNMTIDEKIGQLLIVGFKGTSLNSEIDKLIVENNVGGFILFSRNIKDIDQNLKLINDIKEKNKKNKIPLFISIDEEGGRISRLAKSFKKLPPANVIGGIDKEEISLGYGKLIGERLNALGFNLDFAPVLDVNSNPKNTVIGDRAFSSDEKIVSRNAINVVRGLKDKGIISAVKHFPGHGDTEIDSHKDIPIIYKDLEEIRKIELVPFEAAIKENADMVMIGHILYDKIDSDYPATMSGEIINKLLRDDLAFKGVVVSDDMTMGAIIKNYSLEDASIRFLKAGGDILLICHGRENPSKVFKAIKDALEENVLSQEEIDEKIYRILSLKEKYHINDKAIKDADINEINKETDDFLQLIN